MITQEVLATYDYPESQTYTGEALKGEITFRSVRGTQLIVEWLMEDLVVAKCKLAGVTPLRAILKVSKIQEDWLDYVTDEYELTFYYHESPAIIPVVYAISLALAATGFLIIAWKANPATWEALAKVPGQIAELPSQLLQLPKTLAESSMPIMWASFGFLAIWLIYNKYQKGKEIK